ncbi:hypothetical protein MAR_002356 [Mya arenaria]|uniref:DZIP3-like HEPN domain-containing protein n=1 Tax=Mya arenaria TaxID=6604 RepID=A0ABY7FEB5_MYAAR|nr:hypothetical protein MAR_002356 [Mya arenaria]
MSYEDNDNKNWLKGSLALRITKEGLRDLVDGDSRSIQHRIHLSVIQARNLSPGTTCCQCLTENLFQCPTSGLCSHPRNNCKFHDTPVKGYRSCPSHICDDLRDEICRLHKFGGPSWKNSNADRWCVNHWEIAKCFMPLGGYKDVCSFDQTDYNGVINILINCTAFQQKLSFKVDTVTNILTQARDIGRSIRHSSDLKVTDADLNCYITTMTTLLSDPKYLSRDRKAQEAVLKLNKADTLYISNEDVHEILDEARIVVETGKHQIEQAVTEGKHIIETGKAEIEQAVTEGKHIIETGKTEIEQAVTEGKHAIETGKAEIEQTVTEGKHAIETGKAEIEHAVTEGEHIIETGKEDIAQAVTEGEHALKTGKGQLESSVIEGVKILQFEADNAVVKVSKQIHTDVLVPAENRFEEKVQARLKALKQIIQDTTDIGEREIYSRTSEGIEALDEAVFEAMRKISVSTAEREEGNIHYILVYKITFSALMK